MPFELTPTKLVYGGDALGHHAGHTVMVPRVLPGECAEVEEVRTAKGVIHARPIRILKAAPERVDPPCPYFARCGGCQYQHLAPGLQSATKREILRETLRRLGKIDWKDEIPVHSGPPWNYRNQAQIKVAQHPDGQVDLGFFEAQSHRVCNVETCLLLSPRLNSVLAQLRRPEQIGQLSDVREMDLFADAKDEEVMIVLRGPGRYNEPVMRSLLEGIPGVASVALEISGRYRLLGKPALNYSLNGIEYQVSPGSFFQASRFLAPQLVNSVTENATGELALDLFAGVGLFSLPLARHFTRVIAVEAASPSASDLEANAQTHGFANLRVRGETTFDFLRRFAQAGTDLVVTDPPRSGVDAGSLKLLDALKPREIRYVSCSPPTLARDLGFLVRHGYELASIKMFDFFPQTYHIESLARLTMAGK